MKLLTYILWSCPFLLQSQDITYVEHIKPVIQEHCMPCHQRGNIGPIPLTNYEEVSSYGTMIKYVTSHRIMPPWKANHRYSLMEGANILDPDKIRKIKEWVDGGLVEGVDTSPLSVVIPEPENMDSSMVSFSMAEPFIQEGDYGTHWQVFVIPTYLEKDNYVDAIQFVPGNKSIVKSCAISIDTSSLGQKYDKTDKNYGYTNLGGLSFIPDSYLWYYWTPDQKKKSFPTPYLKKIPAGSTILMHIQYAPSGEVQSDSSSLMVFTAEKNSNSIIIESKILASAEQLLSDEPFIDPYDKRYCHAKVVIQQDCTIHSLTPLAQYVNKSWTIHAKTKNGVAIPLLQIEDWDLQWKRSYSLVHPVSLEKGDEIIIEAYYDNSEENINIPQYPPRKLYPGEGRRDEMFMVQYDYSIPIKNKS